MSSFKQQPFASPTSFASNPEPRCPCMILADSSYSMQGTKIAQLNAGLKLFADEIKRDRLAAQRVEIGLIQFGPIKVQSDFTCAADFVPPHLHAEGGTPTAEAIMMAIDMLNARRQVLRNAGILLFRPWIFLITDGEPTDSPERIDEVATAIRYGDEHRRFAFFAVAVEPSDAVGIAKLSAPSRPPIKLRNTEFKTMFQWLSTSLTGVARSNTAGTSQGVPLESPVGWADV